MQVQDEAKRRDILTAAARRFATRPFHEVRLEDVAADAGVGKGTLYVYFKGKTDLYSDLIRDGVERLLHRVHAAAGEPASDAWKALNKIVDEVAAFADEFPHFFQIMRSGDNAPADPKRREIRQQIAREIEAVIRRGIRQKSMRDSRPDLTAQAILSLVRSALVFGPQGLSSNIVAKHIRQLLTGGIAPTKARS